MSENYEEACGGGWWALGYDDMRFKHEHVTSALRPHSVPATPR